jgi:hypothetical protein
MIHFPCSPSDPLVWDLESLPKESPFLCRLTLGLETPFLALEDPMRFQEHALGLKEWSQKVFTPFASQIEGALLYVGSADFLSSFGWTETSLHNFEIWKQEKGYVDIDIEHEKRLFCADTFAYYLQTLSLHLPDELPIHIWLHAEMPGSLAKKHHILSQERWGHFVLATQGLEMTNGFVFEKERVLLPAERSRSAFCFPEDRMCTSSVLDKIDQILSSFKEPCRVIQETCLAEGWDGVDVLHVLKSTITPQGERKIKGFLAAGGTFVWE